MSTSWHDAAAAEDVWDGTGIPVTVAGRELALFRVGDDLFATGLYCTHGHARLCDGFIEDFTVECPLHQGRFDLRNGAALCPPLTEPVATFPVRIDGGRVFVAFD